MSELEIATLTRTEETKAQYRQIYRRLCHFAVAELRRHENGAKVDRGAQLPSGAILGHDGPPVSPYAPAGPDAPTVAEVISAFLANEGRWAKATARLYRAALDFALEEHRPPCFAADRERLFRRDLDREEAAHYRDALQQQRRPLRSVPHTSAKRAKRVHRQDVLDLVAAIRDTRSRWAEATATWFAAGILLGVSPGEWQAARLDQDKHGRPVLVIEHARLTTGHTQRADRTLPLAHLDAAQRRLVAQQVAFASNHVKAGTFAEYYQQCRQLLRRAAHKLWPRRVRFPTLFPPRRKLTARAKNRKRARESPSPSGDGDARARRGGALAPLAVAGVPGDDIGANRPGRTDEAGPRPPLRAPAIQLELGPLFAQQARAVAPEQADHGGRRPARRGGYQDVHIIVVGVDRRLRFARAVPREVGRLIMRQLRKLAGAV